MITFILNNTFITSSKPSGSSLLDFIRYDAGLTGTKIGCREGDCGACTVLMGTMENNMVTYKSVVSCLTPLGNANGKHIVTIEGINTEDFSPVQQAFTDNAATQCGFCTPGFVMSLTGESLSTRKTTRESAVNAVSGNICRCTGYKSIERAAEAISVALKDKDINDPVGWLVKQRHLPEYFLTIPDKLNDLQKNKITPAGEIAIAGGTDLMVQKAEELADREITTFSDKEELKGITVENGILSIGAATTLTQIKDSQVLGEYIPGISSCLKLVASVPVRNMATVAGNIVNASPIGDFSVMLLALNAGIVTDGPDEERILPLNELYAGYKKLNLRQGEFLKSIIISHRPSFFSFEKVSKRTHLDIASVNSAMSIDTEGDEIKVCSLAAGGVSPVPLFLKETSRYISGQRVTPELICKAAELLQNEISPISDIRGSAEYKRLLLRQLFFAHFLKIFHDKIKLKDLI
jgi:xanthine dehydrogenase small subunit